MYLNVVNLVTAKPAGKISRSILGRVKVSGCQTLREKLMICGPKNSLPIFQPSIRSKSTRIKTRAKK